MRKQLLLAAACAALAGVALAQVEVSSSTTYLLDVDPARYSGPAGQRLMLRVGDQPRHVSIGAQDEICVQLQRDASNDGVINARVRTLTPEPKTANVRVVAPDISPGTYRSTPWGLLLRALPEKSSAGLAKPVGTDNAPVCTI
jgi:hypothetical protein